MDCRALRARNDKKKMALAMTKKMALAMKNSPSWRGRNVSEVVAIQKKLSFSMDCRALRARNDEKYSTRRNDD
jgi:hypothetical protein